MTIGSSVTLIQYDAFKHTALTSVTCLAITPPYIYPSTFDSENYNNATLYVPAVSLTAYQTDSCWKKFYSILPISEEPSEEPGDVDGDGNIGIADVTALIDAILTGNMSNISITAADVDFNGSVDIADVTALIDYILTGNW